VNSQERFAKALSSIARLVSKLQTAEICCGALTREQFETLRTIETSPDETSMGRLSAALRVDLSTMSRNVSVLEREHYVTRARSAQDSRIVAVALTAKGRQALQTLQCDEQDVMAKVYRRLPASKRTSLIEALEAVHGALEGDHVSTQPCCAADGSVRAAR
jgi:DNA-binding MarR family transcriptional regulator